MKAPLYLLAATVMVTSRADITFVQNLDLGIPLEEGTADMTIRASESMVRADIGTDMSTIVDTVSGRVITVLHDDRKFFVMTQSAKELGAPSPAPAVSFTASGNTETINGMEAVEYAGAAEDMKFRVWVTRAMPNQSDLLAEIAKLPAEFDPFQGLLRGAAMPTGFPLRLELTDAAGETSIMTITSISADPVLPAAFEPPTGYQSMDVDEPVVVQEPVPTVPQR